MRKDERDDGHCQTGSPGTRTARSRFGGLRPTPEPTTPPTLHVYSRETIVDVTVTDAKGNPVRGLKRSDFTVLEDGHPQPISSFAEHSSTAPVAPAGVLLPNTYSNTHALPASGPVQILYFDLPYGTSYPQGTDPGADTLQGQIVIRAKKYIADYLRTMPAGTQVAVFVFRADYGLRLLQGFTTDGQKAAAAVDNLVVLSAGPVPKFDPLAAADQIAAYVAGIHGRKNLIWIGSPLPIVRDGGLTWATSPDLVLVHRLMDTYDLFTREQIAIYPFDPQGVPAPGPGGRPRALGRGTLFAEDIATETGGAAIYNTNDFKGAVAKVVNDTSHYYTLSYIPPRVADDGHYHPIKITVDRPGLHLNYRGGYNAEQSATPDAVLSVHMSQATMGLGALPATQLLFDANVTPYQPPADASKPPPARIALALDGKAPVAYGTIFTLQPRQIAFLQSSDETYHGSVEFDLAAYDPTGKLIAVSSQALKLPLSPAEYQDFIQTPFRFLLSIELPPGLPPGPLTLRLGVFDNISHKSGTLEIPLTVARK